MSLEFAKYEGIELEDLGVVSTVVGAKGTLSIAPKSLRPGNTKRIVIILKKKDGTSSAVSCSTTLSDSMRNALAKGMTKEQALAIVAKLSILEGEEGIPFITAPAGASTMEEFAIEKLAKIADLDYADFALQGQLV